MAVIRQQNFLGQQRIDVPHLRALESGVAADFDVLAGRVLAGSTPLVVSGFDLITTGAIGAAATALQLNVASGVLLHPLATEAGSIYSVPSNASAEVLSSLNPNVSGAFAAGQVNYVGVDLIRSVDDSSADLVMFLDANTLVETPKTVPLARTLKYRILISTTDFSSTPNVLPIAKVTTSSTNIVTAIVDARPMAWRLGSGGSAPSAAHSFPWADRAEVTSGAVFTGGDKSLGSLKAWMDAVMSRLWELGGGQYWYSQTADREVKLVLGTPLLGSNNDNFSWDGTTVAWSGLSVAFAHSTVATNTITAGSTTLTDGQCLYVDLDHSTVAALTANKALLTALGTPTLPGSRLVIAWRIGSAVYVVDRGPDLSRSISAVASTTVDGIVRLSHTPTSGTHPVVMSDGGANAANGFVALDANKGASWTSTSGNALSATGNGTSAGIVGTSGSSAGGAGIIGVATGSATTAIKAQGGVIDANSHKVVNVTNPASAQDAATMAYVDASLLAANVPMVQSGTAKNGDTVTFPVAFRATPSVIITGGLLSELGNKWGALGDGSESGAPLAATNTYENSVALSPSSTGFTVRARLLQKGGGSIIDEAIGSPHTIVTGTDAAPNVGGASLSNVTSPAPAMSDSYVVSYSGSVTATTGTDSVDYPTPQLTARTTAVLVLAIEASVDGVAAYTEVAARRTHAKTYSGALSSSGTLTVSASVTATAPGMTSTGKLRIRVVSFTITLDTSGDANGTADYSISLPASSAVTYHYSSTPDQYASKTPSAADTIKWTAIGG